MYRKVSNIRRTLVANKIVEFQKRRNSDLHSQLNTWLQWIGQKQLQDETGNVYVLGLGAAYIRELTVMTLGNHDLGIKHMHLPKVILNEETIVSRFFLWKILVYKSTTYVESPRNLIKHFINGHYLIWTGATCIRETECWKCFPSILD